jgi:arylsulfatase A-like enzyme
VPVSKRDSDPRNSRLTRILADGALLATGSAAALVALEWLFFVTKPSMFSVMGWPTKVGVLFSALLPAILFAAVFGTALPLLGGLWPSRRRRPRVARLFSRIPAALLLAAAALLLVENFTRTVAGFSLASFRSPVRYLYAVGVVAVAALIQRRLQRPERGSASRWRRVGALGLLGLVAISTTTAALRYAPHRSADRIRRTSDRAAPNVLILSSDGVNADRMSIYGAARETTPFLDSLADELLISENHLSNAGLTAASTGALLTGKLPTTTGVTQQFHVFSGRDVYEHLPGVMRQLGYHGIEIGERHYADSNAQGMRQAFQVANSRTLVADAIGPWLWYGTRFPSERTFLGLTGERIRERLAHALGIADMPEAILAPTEQQPAWTSDERRIEALAREIERAPRPFFAHVHLLDTHGPRFRPRRRHFSSGDQTSDWELDFYDDAILGFDSYVEEVVALLEELGELDETLLIVNSDHGTVWRTSQRLPLLFRFPGATRRGTIVANTQRIDIAPTILATLEVAPPDWMEGESLLDAELDPLRPIFSTGWSRHASQSSLALTQCQRWTRLNPDSGELEERVLAGHTDPCPSESLAGAEESRRLILARLSDSEHFVAPLILGARLTRLREENDSAERRLLAEAIRDGATLTRRLDEEMVVARSHWDLWTYDTSPAGLVVINAGDEPLVRRLVVRSGREREFPFRFHIEDGEKTRDFTFERPGAVTVELAPVPPRSERLYVVWSDSGLVSERRRVGVKLATSFADRLVRLRREGDPDSRRRIAEEILSGDVESRELGGGLRAAGLYWDLWTRGSEPAALAVDEGAKRRIAVQSGEGREFPLRFFVEDGESARELVFERPGRMVVVLPATRTGAGLFVLWTEQPFAPGGGDRRSLGVKLSAADG